MAKVFTFYSPVAGKAEADELALIELWKRSWVKMNWEPVVLDESSIQDDKNVRELLRNFRRLPSVNKHNLDYACYLRWLAVAQQGGGFMSDYDVINYAFQPRPFGQLTTYDRFVPCLVSGTGEEFMRAVRWFSEQKIGLIARFLRCIHTSDMLVMKDHQTSFSQSTECVEFGVDGWESAPAVHYCNRAMKPGRLMPRHAHIEQLRAFSSQPAAT